MSAPAVSIHPYFKAHEGKMDEILALLPRFVEKTASEEKCLFYQFTRNGDEIFCREAYADGAGALAHLDNVGPLLEELLALAELTRLELHGPAGELELLRKPLADLGPAWFEYHCGVEG